MPDRPHPRHGRSWRSDLIIRNSFYLTSSTAMMAILGFLFWILVARLYTPGQVGLGTSLISATTLIGYFSLFGLNSTLIRFPAVPKARNAQITQAIAVVVLASCVIASAYLAGLPWYGRKLLFIRADVALSVVFVACCVFSAVNLLTDAVFIGRRVPQYNLLTDGVVQGLTKLALPVLLVGFGASGLLGAAGGGYAAAVLASLFFMRRKLGFRFDFRPGRSRLVEQTGFSAASYASAALLDVPVVVIPLIVLQRLGADAAGYYYVAFQIATLLNSLSHAVGEAVFAEISNDESRFAELLRKGAVILGAVQVPAAVIVAAGGGLLLRAFGAVYETRGQTLLVVLAVGSLAVALNYWGNVALRLARRLKHLVVSGVVFAAVTIGLAVAWAPHGLVWVGWAWCVGNLASGVYVVVVLIGGHAATPSSKPETALARSEEDRHVNEVGSR